MALYAYKKDKPKLITPRVKRSVILPMVLLITGVSILGYVAYPYLSFFLTQTFKVDTLHKEFLSPKEQLSFLDNSNPNNRTNDYSKNLAVSISDLNKEIKQTNSFQDLSNEKGKMYLTVDKLGLKHIPININTESSSEEDYNPILSGNIAHFKGTSLPGHPGKTFLYGHSWRGLFSGNSRTFSTGIFTDIDKLNLGDEFSIEYKGTVFKYSVIMIKEVDRDDFSVIIGDDKKTATLMTCTPPGIGVKRLIVDAIQEN